MRDVISVADAQARILAQVTRIAPPEVAAVGASLGRVLAEDVRAGFDVPPTANSAVDGYAVRSEDIPSSGSRELTVVAEATDLSRTGIAVRAVPRQLETGEIVTLQLALGAAAQAVAVDRAEVMWAHKDTAGLRFLDLSPITRATLDTLTTHV